MRSRPVREVLGAWAAALGLAAAAGLTAMGCGTVKSPTEVPAGGEGDGTAFTFAQVQAQVFTPNCAKAGCHVTGVAAGGMVLEAGRSYGEIVGRPSQENPALARVAPGEPERSYLLKKVRGDTDITGSRMPQDGPPFLSREQIEGIAGWIRAGALND